MWRYFPKGSRKKTFKLPKVVRKKQPKLSSPIERCPNDILFCIIDYLDSPNDRMCLALTCRRFMQLSPTLRISVPSSLTRIRDMAKRRDMDIIWPFWGHIIYVTDNFHPCTGCSRDRSNKAEEWAHVFDEYDEGTALKALAADAIQQWCRKKIAAFALCPECKQTKSELQWAEEEDRDDVEMVED